MAVSACDWYPMMTFGGTPNLSLYTRLKRQTENKQALHIRKCTEEKKITKPYRI